MKEAQAKSATPEMVSTTSPKPSVRASVSFGSGNQEKEETATSTLELTPMQVFLLGKRLRRTKRRLFLDAVAQNQTKLNESSENAMSNRKGGAVAAAWQNATQGDDDKEKNVKGSSRLDDYTDITPSILETASESFMEDQAE